MITDRFTIGILAHVDAGKTTLAEGLLYETGSIRKAGRVDHGDAYFDSNEIERARGITIFSKYAEMPLGNKTVTLLDTPGHVDFSAEMERALSVMDYAILVIDGAKGVQSHTKTLWKLMETYQIPVFVFVNKMDRKGCNADRIMEQLTEELSDACVNFTGCLSHDGEFLENTAMCTEDMMEAYLNHQDIPDQMIAEHIRKREVIPCFFGSALKMERIQEFLQALDHFTISPDYPKTFQARVFKIARDAHDSRLTFLKITGGTLKTRDQISDIYGRSHRVNQIRIYSSDRYRNMQEVPAGSICAVMGPETTYAGEVFGEEGTKTSPVMTSVLSYRIIPPDDMDPQEAYRKLQKLEEEDPDLHISWNEQNAEIRVSLMGEVQLEILKQIISERFHMEVTFGQESIIYKETIAEPAEGIGHFEPLRHYAEVHLLLEPGERGSGIVFVSDCSEEVLSASWQKLILSDLKEKNLRGVLTGSELTDVKITLIAGRAHEKHTQGSDFREAACRAVRQGLMMAKNILLEPVFEYTLALPSENLGRAMNDIRNMHGDFEAPEQNDTEAVLHGTCPVSEMQGYGMEVVSYTGGRGQLQTRVAGYEPCHNSQEVIEQIGYDSDTDLSDPSSSLFCSHGTAVYVPWDKVPEYAHVESPWARERKKQSRQQDTEEIRQPKRDGSSHSSGMPAAFSADEQELREIFERTYKSPYERKSIPSKRVSVSTDQRPKEQKHTESYLLVDGYNIIFSWMGTSKMSDQDLDAARGRLMDILSNYQGYRRMHLILVFDAYKVKGGTGSVFRYHNIDVVYTREAETADAYIEKVTHEMSEKDYDVTVASSDGLVQVIIWGNGARRMTALELKADIENANIEIDRYLSDQQSSRHTLLDSLSETDADMLRDARLGKNGDAHKEWDKNQNSRR